MYSDYFLDAFGRAMMALGDAGNVVVWCDDCGAGLDDVPGGAIQMEAALKRAGWLSPPAQLMAIGIKQPPILCPQCWKARQIPNPHESV